jgi:hypothetical protein
LTSFFSLYSSKTNNLSGDKRRTRSIASGKDSVSFFMFFKGITI